MSTLYFLSPKQDTAGGGGGGCHKKRDLLKSSMNV